MTEHYIERCICGVVISQCRCPGPGKAERISTEICTHSPTLIHETALVAEPGPGGPTLNTAAEALEAVVSVLHVADADVRSRWAGDFLQRERAIELVEGLRSRIPSPAPEKAGEAAELAERLHDRIAKLVDWNSWEVEERDLFRAALPYVERAAKEGR